MTVTYRAEVGSGMTEHEIVHVFAGLFDGAVRPDPREADGFAWVEPLCVQSDIAAAPMRYAAWFRVYCTQLWRSLTGS